jgi:biopolymer transport protein TolR
MGFGRLERTSGKEPMSEINVTPMVDVMLVLVVILLITAPLLSSSIPLDLPKAEATRPSDAPKFVSVVVNAKGEVFLNDKPTTPDALQADLQSRAKQNPDTEVQLRADTTVAYGKVVEVIGLAQKAGLTRIAFAAQASKP